MINPLSTINADHLGVGRSEPSATATSVYTMSDPVVSKLMTNTVEGGKDEGDEGVGGTPLQQTQQTQGDQDQDQAQDEDEQATDSCSTCSTNESDELVLKGCMYAILNRFLCTGGTGDNSTQTVAQSLHRIASSLERLERILSASPASAAPPS